ncbi:STAS domain-containing protein [Asanoa sp. WMMD1127]|uniref:STAS domain-containing protein n=1 Tax=Asanoa sp. WMMD1127 TaxID=3016107 RepID=UPI002416B750|nr:STAS domain-containing protein [Asanoa sp. WMMD1127]MDG4823248.1 STAS domain-containing protein [Asanoa sp. WMMD1127]
MANAQVGRRLLDNGTVVFDLRGELDVAVNDALRDVLEQTIRRQRPPMVVVNMRHVTFVDSTGMGALVAGLNAARDQEVRFVVQEVAPFVEKQLRIAGLYETLVQAQGS